MSATNNSRDLVLDNCIFANTDASDDMSAPAFKNNHLDRVICQVMFDPVLSIDRDADVFQNRIKDMYPFTNVSIEPVMPMLGAPAVNNYSFEANDHEWTVNLTRSFVSLTSLKYDSWESFSDRMLFLLKTLNETFGIDSFVRVGLRYINAFRLSKLQMTGDEPWSDFLQESTLGMFNAGYGNMTSHSSATEYVYDDCKIRSMTGQIQFNDDGEVGFLIDNDIYSDRVHSYSEIASLLDQFNEKSFDMLKKMVKNKMIERIRR